MSSSTRTLLVLIVAIAARAGLAQDMIGPSGPAATSPPLTSPAEPAEPDAAAPGARDLRGVDSVGEGDVQRADSAPRDAAGSGAMPDAASGSAPADASADPDAAADSAPGAQADVAAEAGAAPDAASGAASDAAHDAAADAGDELAARYEAAWTQHVDDADYEAAAALARSWIGAVERADDDGDVSALFTPYMRLGQALEWAEDPVGAAVALGRAVEIGESAFGVFDLRLSGPLNALGRALLEQGRAEDAVPVLMRAKDITHRNLGIYNLEQEAIVQSLAECFLQTGDWLQATREQRFLLGANEKAYGENTLELVPALQRWAKWNVFVGRDDVGRKYFRQALEILENEYGPNDLRLIDTLDMVANSYYKAAVSRWPREGARSLERIVDIYRAQEFVDQADLMRAQTRLGDWLMLSRRPREAVAAYQAAIAAAHEAGMDPDAIRSVFGFPQPLHANNRPLSTPLPERASDADDGPRYLLLEYSVDRNGRPRKISVLEDTVGLVSVKFDIKDRIMSTAFRPRFTLEGEPVETHGLRYRFEFDSSGNYGEPSVVIKREAGAEPVGEPDAERDADFDAEPDAEPDAPADPPADSAAN